MPPKLQQSLFKVGDLAETRSAIRGFRGAWFRCEIKAVGSSKGHRRYRVSYYDYDDPDHGIEWVNLYQGQPKGRRKLMMRPQYPPIVNISELPSLNAVTEVTVVVDGVWSVGDKVDWCKDDCYWSGTVTKSMGGDKVKLKLLPEPEGEGGFYDACCKDLRPSLDWSPDSGWTFPAPVDGQNGHSHARLVQPVKRALASESLVDGADEINENADATPKSSLDFNDSISSQTSESSLPLLNRLIHSKVLAKQKKDLSGIERDQTCGENMELDTGATAGKLSCSDSVSSSYVRDASTEVPVAGSAEKQDSQIAPAKKFRANEGILLNSTSCDSIESAILDLEELACRVKWLKQILKSEGPSTSVGKKWELLEHSSVSAPK